MNSRKTKLVSVIVLNWNGREMLGQCLNSLRRQTYRDFETIVVENGSTDGSLEFVREHYSEVTLLPQDHNTGFDGGANIGFNHTKTPFAVLLNNDAIADENWLENLIEAIDQKSDAGAVTSKILAQSIHKGKYKIDSTGDYYTVWGLPFPRGRGEIDNGQYDDRLNVFGASGGATIYRMSALKKTGLFDEEFFAYYEDVDLSFRMRFLGYEIYYEPKAVVYHKISATSGGGKSPFTRYHSIKNTWYVYLRNMPASLFWKYLPRFIFTSLLQLVSSARNGLLLAHLKGVGRAIVMTPYELSQRFGIQKTRKLGSKEIDNWLIKSMPPLQQKAMRKYFGRWHHTGETGR